jgi:tetratricopeptide (TPR) repeat protein/phage gp36-like protein
MSGSPRRIAGEEETRRRLARTLHDDHGQRVAALGFELRAVCRHFTEDDPRHTQVDAVARRLGELGEDLRRLSHDLHPAVLERRGLAVALLDACAEIEARQDLRVELDLPDAGHTIPPEVALAVYRIAQEGLTNTARHAGARTARLELRTSGGAVRLSLTDDGAGFDVDEARRTGGLGLACMEERAQLLGGRCRIVSTPGAGTAIEVSVPRLRLRRWLRQRRGWVVAVTLVVFSLCGGLVATLDQARRTAVEARRTEATVHFLEGLFASATPRQAHGEPPDTRELLRRGAERLDRELAEEPLLRARLLDTLGGIHTELGLYDQARPLLEEALALRLRLRGEEHPEVAATLVRLGSLAHLSGQGDAVALFRRALVIREARARREPEELADLLNKLGAALGAKGRFDEAEATLRRSLALHEDLFGPEDLRIAKILHNLSGIAYYRERNGEAEKLIARALEIRQAKLAEDDLELAGSREALALLRRRQGRMDEAAELLERLAATTERVYGPDHPQLARTLLNLGLVRADLGAGETARELFERALAIDEAALTPEHPQLVRTLATLAEHHLREGHFDEAEPLYRRLLELHERGVDYGNWDLVLAQRDQLLGAGKPEKVPAATRRSPSPAIQD